VRLAKLLMLSATIATATLGAAAAGEAQANTLTATIAPMPLNRALEQFAKQTGLQVVYVSAAASGIESSGAAAGLTREAALRALLSGTGLKSRFIDENTVTLIQAETQTPTPIKIAQAAPTRAAVETVTVTSSKLGGADVQSIPIAITALSQEQLTATQTAGGPDLVKQVPNLTFTKTNFSGYSINIRGIGTQAISVTTDPAVAVAMNDIPFIRNHFFEQEFFDVGQLEVLRGPQGTLYGRNATAGVVNITTAKPTDQFEAMASAEIGNYHQRRFEGMINLPIVDDRLDIRLAGEWTKRQGYSFNALTDKRIDGRDLWSGRATIGLKPLENLQMYLIWEHFSEDDDRMRSAKQLCKRDPGPSTLNGVAIDGVGSQYGLADALSQGCLPASLYSAESFETPNGQSLPYFNGLKPYSNFAVDIDPYASEKQSRNLRVIESELEPSYKAKNDILELSADYKVTPVLTVTSQTGFNRDFLYSVEDYNRFNTAHGVFRPNSGVYGQVSSDGVFCDPQLGCSDRMVAEDLNSLKSWQLSQEFRLTSNFPGPFNFSLGGNYLHYEIDENYYVFINALTLIGTSVQTGTIDFYTIPPWQPGVSDNHQCLAGLYPPDITKETLKALTCTYIDPNPLSDINGNGHNYFRSDNPYVLNSYAGFGEAYYNITPDLKFTGGLRWTNDQKHFPMIPSMLLVQGWGSYVQQVLDQEWSEVTGRTALNWSPKLDFTDQTLVYGSFSHGYKAGGANPPGAVLLSYGDYGVAQPVHPLTFEPEFINAFEIGTKNTLLDGALTLNGGLFYYDYKNYQISQIVDRTAVNLNVDAKVKGAEVEATYEPIPGLRFNFAGGWEHSRINDGQSAIDLMDRTAGHTDWVVLKPSVTQSSNCIIPAYVAADAIGNGYGPAIFNYGQGVKNPGGGSSQGSVASACQTAYNAGLDPLTGLTYQAAPVVSAGGIYGTVPPPGYIGFNPATAPNNGEGFAKDIGGNDLPNTPPFTVSAGAQYTVPLSSDWAGTLRADYYWQDYSWARIWNDNPYDRLRGYTNVNVSLILTSQNGWQVMLYDKNLFNTTDITGAFLNSDDSGLTTNVFMTDPKLIGVRVTKNW
jgi:outer membrane receptor protein involved in Fe transport